MLVVCVAKGFEPCVVQRHKNVFKASKAHVFHADLHWRKHDIFFDGHVGKQVELLKTIPIFHADD